MQIPKLSLNIHFYQIRPIQVELNRFQNIFAIKVFLPKNEHSASLK
jgi:hypothetical protein